VSRYPLAVSYDAQIVDPETGLMTPYFQRVLQTILGESEEVAEELGDAVPQSRVLTAGVGLSGGGNLTADRTFDLDAVLDDLTDVDTTTNPPADGDGLFFDNASGLWLPDAPAGGGSAWTLAGAGQTATGVWDQTVDGNKATVDFTGLSSYSDIMLVAWNTTKSISGVLGVRVSVDNGVSFFAASGDYHSVDAAGISANAAFLVGMHITNTALTRSGVAFIQGAGTDAAFRTGHSLAALGYGRIVASDAVVDAVRIFPTGGGNLTGGRLYCYVR
jgi:hypothetical protein